MDIRVPDMPDCCITGSSFGGYLASLSAPSLVVDANEPYSVDDETD